MFRLSLACLVAFATLSTSCDGAKSTLDSDATISFVTESIDLGEIDKDLTVFEAVFYGDRPGAGQIHLDAVSCGCFSVWLLQGAETFRLHVGESLSIDAGPFIVILEGRSDLRPGETVEGQAQISAGHGSVARTLRYEGVVVDDFVVTPRSIVWDPSNHGRQIAVAVQRRDGQPFEIVSAARCPRALRYETLSDGLAGAQRTLVIELVSPSGSVPWVTSPVFTDDHGSSFSLRMFVQPPSAQSGPRGVVVDFGSFTASESPAAIRATAALRDDAGQFVSWCATDGFDTAIAGVGSTVDEEGGTALEVALRPSELPEGYWSFWLQLIDRTGASVGDAMVTGFNR